MAILVLAAAACSNDAGVPPVSGSTAPSTSTTLGAGTTSNATSAATTAPVNTSTTSTMRTTTTTTLPPCPAPVWTPQEASGDGFERHTGDDPAETAIAISRATFRCATDVVIVPTGDLARAAFGARLAAGLGGPLLYAAGAASPTMTTELERLAPHRVITIGDVVAIAPEFTEMQAIEGSMRVVAASVNRSLGTSTSLPLPAGPATAIVDVTVASIDAGFGLLPPPEPAASTTTSVAEPSGTTSTSGDGATPSTTAAGSASTTSTSTSVAAPSTTTTPATTPVAATDDPIPVDELPVTVHGYGVSGDAWLVDVDRPQSALAAAVAATASGGLMAVVDGTDLRRIPEVGRAMRVGSGVQRPVHLVGDITDHAEWQVPILVEGDELPGGGYLMFPGRRLVALYGNPLTTALGVLGEQPPAEAVTRARELAEPYGADGVMVVPAFEIIATVAAGNAGADGDYSNEMPIEVLRPWVDIARDEGLFVLLDLQPGRTDFLSQAKRYEELLREPHVGLALDPEWRLKPDQVHLVQFGTVSAAEVNSVIDWLVELVRENHLPQKTLLLHQFRFSMIPERELIDTPTELAILFQMDGQGRVSDKYATWGALTRDTAQYDWWWGWKNFYDEDVPGPIPPSEVLELMPDVVYVSYQ